jgi:hypothetical protein
MMGRPLCYDADTTLEARVLWHHVRLGLYGMRSAPQRGERWASQCLARLAQGMKGFLARISANSELLT